MRRYLVVVGVGLTVGFACAMVAALHPAMPSPWNEHGVRALTLIGHHARAWELANWMFAVGIGFTLAGMAALTGLLNRQSPGSPLPTVALTLVAVASSLWLANLAFRLTATVRVADVVSGGGAMPGWYEDVRFWTDNALLNAAALTGGLAMILYGWAVAGGGVLPGWTGWLAVGFGALLVGEFILTGDTVPLLLHLAPLFFGVTALIRVVRRPALASGPATGDTAGLNPG